MPTPDPSAPELRLLPADLEALRLRCVARLALAGVWCTCGRLFDSQQAHGEHVERTQAGCPVCHGEQTVRARDPLTRSHWDALEPCPALDYDAPRGVAACRLPGGTFDYTPYDSSVPRPSSLPAVIR